MSLPVVHLLRKTWHSAFGPVALVGAMALVNLCLANPASAGDKKVVGVTLFSLQNPYVVSVGEAMTTLAG